MTIGGFALVLTLMFDQLSKWIVFETLGPDGSRDVVEIIPGLLQLTFVRNTGSAFGLFQGNSEILKVLAIGAVVALLVYYVRSAARDWALSLALGLQLGGALGNIIDRFIHGYVVDFIDVPRFPTFNVADSAITVGVVLLMWSLLFRDNRAAQEDSQNQRTDQASVVGDDA
ncbi:MAG: signal peptidase II [Thermomicrobiales bacterium]